MAKVYTKDGQAFEVPAEQLLETLRNGQGNVYLDAKQPVWVLSDKGEWGTVHPSRIFEIEGTNYRLASDKEVAEKKYGDQGAAAFALGAADAATADLASAVLAKGGFISRERLKGVQEGNELANLAGYGVGTIASLIGAPETKVAEVGVAAKGLEAASAATKVEGPIAKIAAAADLMTSKSLAQEAILKEAVARAAPEAAAAAPAFYGKYGNFATWLNAGMDAANKAPDKEAFLKLMTDEYRAAVDIRNTGGAAAVPSPEALLSRFGVEKPSTNVGFKNPFREGAPVEGLAKDEAVLSTGTGPAIGGGTPPPSTPDFDPAKLREAAQAASAPIPALEVTETIPGPKITAAAEKLTKDAGGNPGSLLKAATFIPRSIMGAGASLSGGAESALIKALTTEGAAPSNFVSLISKVGGHAVGGAAEGGLLALGAGIKEEALGDPEVAGQSLEANVAFGLGAGFLLGGAAGALGGGMDFAKRKFGAIAAKHFDNLESAAWAEQYGKFSDGLGLSRDELGKLYADHGDDWLKSFEAYMEKKGVVPGDDAAIFTQGAHPVKNIKRMEGAVEAAGAYRGFFRDALDEAAGGPSIAPERIAATIRSVGADTPVEEAVMKKLLKNLPQEAEGAFSAQPQTLNELNKLVREAFRGTKAADPYVRSMHWRVYQALDTLQDDVVQELIGKVDHGAVASSLSRLMPGAPVAAEDAVNRYIEAGHFYRTMIPVARKAADRVFTKPSSTFREAANYVFRGMGWSWTAGHGLSGVVLGAARRAAVAFGAAEARQAVKRGLVGQAAGLRGVRDALVGSQNSINEVLQDLALGRYRTAKKLYAPLEFLQVLTGTKDQSEALQKAVQHAQAHGSDPLAMADHTAAATQGTANIAPNITAARMATLGRQMTAIKGALPQLRTQQELMRPHETAKMTDKEADKFAQTVYAALDPIATLARVTDGSLSAQEAQTLKQVYPQFIETVWQQMQRVIMDGPKAPKPEVLQALSLLYDVALMPSMDKAYISRAQEMYKVATSGPKAANNIQLNQAFQSESQRLAQPV